MRAWFVRIGKALMPTDEASESVVARMAPGECAEFRVLRPRSSQWHRMYFGLCRTIGQNQDPPRDEDSVDQEVRILSGHYDVYKFQGRDVLIPKRIAFDRMTADEWVEYWRKAEAAISERFGSEYFSEVAA